MNNGTQTAMAPAASRAPQILQQSAALPSQPRSTMDMVSAAVAQGASIELVERLMALHKEFEADEARKAFFDAKASFKKDAPDILRDMKNTQFSSKYTSLGHLVGTVNIVLARHGLDASWDIAQGDKGEITVTCILTHLAGHQERVAIKSLPDTSGGSSKNPIQQVKSAITYLRGATFEAVTGIATKSSLVNADDDANGAYGRETLNKAQVMELRALAEKTGVSDARICKWANVQSVEEILAIHFRKAMNVVGSAKKEPSNA